MPTYTISITKSIEAKDADEAWKEFEKDMEAGNYGHDNIEIDEEEEEKE